MEFPDWVQVKKSTFIPDHPTASLFDIINSVAMCLAEFI